MHWSREASWEIRAKLYGDALEGLAFKEWLDLGDRAEQVDQDRLYAPIWPAVNAHLGTDAQSIPQLVDQLGIARFGKRAIVGDAFCGGGSIPFEAARLGCDVVASDLNPIACMLTWGALNIVGADAETREKIDAAHRELVEKVDAAITELGIEHNARGDRAKAYLYCLEARCPATGYMVPMLPSRIISRSRRTIAVLEPDAARMRFNIHIANGVSDEEMAGAEFGTVIDKDLVVTIDGATFRTAIKTIRGDREGSDGETVNALRRWERQDFVPRETDIFQERLYAIQWITKETFYRHLQETYFAGVTEEDLVRERIVEALVRTNLTRWQERGLVPDTMIESGAKTDEPIRTRGWTDWHHLFGPRHLLLGSIVCSCVKEYPAEASAFYLSFAKVLNYMSRLTQWMPRSLPLKCLPTWSITFSIIRHSIPS